MASYEALLQPQSIIVLPEGKFSYAGTLGHGGASEVYRIRSIEGTSVEMALKLYKEPGQSLNRFRHVNELGNSDSHQAILQLESIPPKYFPFAEAMREYEISQRLRLAGVDRALPVASFGSYRIDSDTYRQYITSPLCPGLNARSHLMGLSDFTAINGEFDHERMINYKVEALNYFTQLGDFADRQAEIGILAADINLSNAVAVALNTSGEQQYKFLDYGRSFYLPGFPRFDTINYSGSVALDKLELGNTLKKYYGRKGGTGLEESMIADAKMIHLRQIGVDIAKVFSRRFFGVDGRALRPTEVLDYACNSWESEYGLSAVQAKALTSLLDMTQNVSSRSRSDLSATTFISNFREVIE